MSTGPLVPVLLHKMLKAWPGNASGGRVRHFPLARALLDAYRTDAHLAAYSVPAVGRRLDKEVLTAAGAHEGVPDGVPMVLAIFDVDDPEAHAEERPSTPEWWTAQRPAIDALLAGHPGGYVYRTRGGYRIVYVLPTPVVLRDHDHALAWKRLYRSWVEYLRTTFGIVADPACTDWTRLYRLPRATRDAGGESENLPTIGDAENVGQWVCNVPNLAHLIAHVEPAGTQDAGPGWQSNGATAYGKAAVERALGRLLVAPPTTRNVTLNEEAFGMGQLHAASHVGDVREALIDAATRAGLPAEEARRTADRGWEAGVKTPRRRLPSRNVANGQPGHAGAQGNDPRPTLIYSTPEGEVPLHVLAPQAVEVFADRCGDSIFSHGDMLARTVTVREAPDASGIQRSAAPRIAPLPDAILREQLDAALKWERIVKTKQGPAHKETWCPTAVADAIRDRGEWPGIRPLLQVVTAPTMRADGTILDVAGYDAATALLYAPGAAYPTVPAAPTPAQVREAWDVLLAPYAEFPFLSPADRAAVAAYMLAFAARPAIDGPVPMHVVTAPAFGTGKTLLVEAGTIAMTGHPPDLLPPVGGRPSDAESEWRKRLTVLVMEAPRAALLDNVPDGGVLVSRSLAALLTALTWTDRILGQSKNTRALPHRTVWSCTGCNIGVAGDLARRSISIAFDAECEDPHLRTFKVRDLAAHVAREHPRLLTAALTMLRGYVCAGRPEHGKALLGKFEAWDALVRGAVIWATGLAGSVADPLDTQARLLAESPEKDGLRCLLEAWWDALGEQTVTAREVVIQAGRRDATALHDALVALGIDDDGHLDPQRLGRCLGTVKGRVVAGLKLQRRGDRQGTASWGVVRVGGDGGSRGIGAPPTRARENSEGSVPVDGPRESHESHEPPPPCGHASAWTGWQEYGCEDCKRRMDAESDAAEAKE